MPTLGRRPIWYQNKLFYVEYGLGAVTTRDGKRNEVF
jgi:gluconolactonase